MARVKLKKIIGRRTAGWRRDVLGDRVDFGGRKDLGDRNDLGD